MQPELQNLIEQAQQNAIAAQHHANLLGYTTFAAIVICAIFSVLIFWKLCQIHRQLEAHIPPEPQNPFKESNISRVAASQFSTSQPVSDDSRFMPKK